MGKGLSQITFDFAPAEEEENTPIAPPPVVKEEKEVIEENIPETPVIENKATSGKRGRKSLKEIALHADLLQIPEDDILFKKQYYSIGAVAGMFKRIGYHKKQTMHGFRHLISTALNDKGYEADWVERQLAHGDPDKIRGIYNKAAYLEPRRKMMQEWADYLDLIKRKADVIPIRREVG